VDLAPFFSLEQNRELTRLQKIMQSLQIVTSQFSMYGFHAKARFRRKPITATGFHSNLNKILAGPAIAPSQLCATVFVDGAP